MILLRTTLVLLALVLAGCASNPPVQLATSSKSQFDGAAFKGESVKVANPTPGAEAFRAFYQGGTGFVSLGSVRWTVEDMATKHCARQNKAVRQLEERTSSPPFILGNFPRVEWVFECISTPTTTKSLNADKLTRLEQLKKLLDSGVNRPGFRGGSFT